MKKLIVSMLCLGLMAAGKASADNTLSVNDVTLPQGGQATVEVTCNFSTDFLGLQFDLELNEDGKVTPNMDTKGKPVAELGFSETSHTFSNSQLSESEQLLQKYRFMCVSLDNDQLPNSGTLVRITLNASAEAQVGQVYEVKLAGIELTDADKQKVNLDDIAFSITIGEPADTRTLLDETSTTAPAAASNVDVRVKRTITAGVWNTICLPFAMTATQVKEAFGDDVLLGDFTGCETELDGDENVTGLTVKFNSATAIEANHPYIIKVSANVEEFTADGVTIEAEEEPSVDKDPYVVGKGKTAVTFYNRFVGNYVNGTQVPAETLFLNSDMFWYSTGATTIKGLRGYFDFYDVLSSYDAGTNARMRIAFNETNRMDGVKQAAAVTDGNIYSLQGVQVENPQKGPYIKDGKVVIFK